MEQYISSGWSEFTGKKSTNAQISPMEQTLLGIFFFSVTGVNNSGGIFATGAQEANIHITLSS